MQILIKMLNGERISLNVETTDTILQVKTILQEKEGIDIEQIRLICGGRQLADEATIGDSNIKPGTVLHMVMQLRG